MSHYHQEPEKGILGSAGAGWPVGWHWVSGWQADGVEVARGRGQAHQIGPRWTGGAGLSAGFVLRGLLEHAEVGSVGEGRMVWARTGPGGDWDHAWRAGRNGVDLVWVVYQRGYLEKFLHGVELLPRWLRGWLSGEETVSGGGLMGSERVWLEGREDGGGFGHQLAHPPVLPMARDLWYRAKATELLTGWLWPASESTGRSPRRAAPAGDPRVRKAMAWLRDHLDEDLDLAAVAAAAHASPAYLSRLFRKETGRTLMQERRRLRVAMAKEMLASGRMNISEAAVEVGYRSLSQFARAFAEETGCAPGEWLRGRR